MLGSLIVLEFKDKSTLVGHFVSPPTGKEKRDRGDERGTEESGTGMKVKKQKK